MQQDTTLEILSEGHDVFLTGAPGTGKTYVLKKYIEYVRSHKIAMSITASTGIAASHINGMTLHSFAGLGITETLDEKEIAKILSKGHVVSRIRKTQVLIIDEISMVSIPTFEAVDTILKRVHMSQKPFGGIQIVMSGDFFQLPPISRGSNNKKYVWQSDLWDELDPVICYLEKNFRQEDDQFVTILDEIRRCDVSEGSRELLEECKNTDIDNQNMLRLYTHNLDVDRINMEQLKKIPSEARAFRAGGKGKKVVIDSILGSTLITPICTLKIGALVIFIKNNPEAGYVNGTLGTIIEFEEGSNYPIVETLQGEEIIAEPQEWVKEDEKGKIVGGVRQIPLRLAWALTVHKSQGMTIDACEMDLSKAFEVGQGYVALSRVRSLEGLRLLGANENALCIDPLVKAFDEGVQSDSRYFEEDFLAVSKEKHTEKKTSFIVMTGGTLEKQAKNGSNDNTSLASTYDKTKNLLSTGMTLDEIAKERGLTIDTILTHCDKLITQGYEVMAIQIGVEQEVLTFIKKVREETSKSAQDESEKENLSPKQFFEKANEKYTYEQIKKAILYLRIE